MPYSPKTYLLIPLPLRRENRTQDDLTMAAVSSVVRRSRPQPTTKKTPRNLNRCPSHWAGRRKTRGVFFCTHANAPYSVPHTSSDLVSSHIRTSDHPPPPPGLLEAAGATALGAAACCDDTAGTWDRTCGPRPRIGGLSTVVSDHFLRGPSFFSVGAVPRSRLVPCSTNGLNAPDTWLDTVDAALVRGMQPVAVGRRRTVP